ncbi:MAG: gamma-glutamylcyclotransferase [Hoeflea sp.]|uniref:gamma-glutamylcyclotransferase n=1 Tax=Hoeflea sp. TaxID=1940281 RepID=UPI003EF69DAF
MSKIERADRPGAGAAGALDEGTAGAVGGDLAARYGPGELVGYFGYGSLVNRATLTTGLVQAHRARLKGWRRSWRPRPDMGPTPGVTLPDGITPSLLSVHRAEGFSIDGLLVIDLAVNLVGIDAREFRYHRRDIGLADLEFTDPGHGLGADITLHVYEARVEHPAADGPAPILRSYLDAVMQGFLREFGPEGVHRFVAETDAFHMPIHEDRHAAIYPRAVSLSASEIALFDAALGRRSQPV